MSIWIVHVRDGQLVGDEISIHKYNSAQQHNSYGHYVILHSVVKY